MALPPRFNRPQTFNVEPGTIKFSQPGDEGLTDYSFQRPTTGPGQIPDSLRGRSYLRPLLQATGDNGGPLSLADMQANSNAMDALDEHFMLRPSAKAAELMALEAETAKNEALSQDPFAEERAKSDLLIQRRMFELGQKAKLDQDAEAGRRDAYGSDVEGLNARLAVARKRAAGMPEGPAKQKLMDQIQDIYDAESESIRSKHGLGAKIGGSGFYRGPEGS